MQPIEIHRDGDVPLAYIVRAGWMPETTLFLTPDHFGQQMGMIVYGAGQEIRPHLHLPVVREVHGTTECIVVRKGTCLLDLYDAHKRLLSTHELPPATSPCSWEAATASACWKTRFCSKSSRVRSSVPPTRRGSIAPF